MRWFIIKLYLAFKLVISIIHEYEQAIRREVVKHITKDSRRKTSDNVEFCNLLSSNLLLFAVMPDSERMAVELTLARVKICNHKRTSESQRKYLFLFFWFESSLE